jgi:protein-tyrosine phosphatase
MIDIHSHILPGLDDGPQTLEEAVAMVRMAAAGGTTDIVATPHSNLQFSFDPELVDRKIAELAEASGPVIRIHRGCDFHLHYDNIQDALAHPARYAINGKQYVLVEFSELLITRTAGEVFQRMRLAGITPIVTHPERNSLLQRRIGQLETWVRDGCYLQVTAMSLLGRFGRHAKDFAGELMRRALVHIVASDAHDTKDRPPLLDEAFGYVSRNYGAACAERLFVRNPGAVIAGEPIEDVQFEEPPRQKWYHFW